MSATNPKPTSNPLLLAALIATVAVAGAVYQMFVQAHVNPLHIIRFFVFLLFLALYFLKSRFAWHVFAIAALIVTPAYVLLPRVQNHSVRPETLPILLVLSLVCIAYLWWTRRPYFSFIQRDSAQNI